MKKTLDSLTCSKIQELDLMWQPVNHVGQIAQLIPGSGLSIVVPQRLMDRCLHLLEVSKYLHHNFSDVSTGCFCLFNLDKLYWSLNNGL